MMMKKRSNIVKWNSPIKVIKMNLPDLGKDPFLIKKREDAVEAMERNPPPEWLLKRMRGED
ncbi:MAG TPA: hypothetical protein VGM31_05640 [Puia sp.]|jgi:hypothetical protein